MSTSITSVSGREPTSSQRNCATGIDRLPSRAVPSKTGMKRVFMPLVYPLFNAVFNHLSFAEHKPSLETFSRKKEREPQAVIIPHLVKRNFLEGEPPRKHLVAFTRFSLKFSHFKCARGDTLERAVREGEMKLSQL